MMPGAVMLVTYEGCLDSGQGINIAQKSTLAAADIITKPLAVNTAGSAITDMEPVKPFARGVFGSMYKTIMRASCAKRELPVELFSFRSALDRLFVEHFDNIHASLELLRANGNRDVPVRGYFGDNAKAAEELLFIHLNQPERSGSAAAAKLSPLASEDVCKSFRRYEQGYEAVAMQLREVGKRIVAVPHGIAESMGNVVTGILETLYQTLNAARGGGGGGDEPTNRQDADSLLSNIRGILQRNFPPPDQQDADSLNQQKGWARRVVDSFTGIIKKATARDWTFVAATGATAAAVMIPYMTTVMQPLVGGVVETMAGGFAICGVAALMYKLMGVLSQSIFGISKTMMLLIFVGMMGIFGGGAAMWFVAKGLGTALTFCTAIATHFVLLVLSETGIIHMMGKFIIAIAQVLMGLIFAGVFTEVGFGLYDAVRAAAVEAINKIDEETDYEAAKHKPDLDSKDVPPEIHARFNEQIALIMDNLLLKGPEDFLRGTEKDERVMQLTIIMVEYLKDKTNIDARRIDSYKLYKAIKIALYKHMFEPTITTTTTATAATNVAKPLSTFEVQSFVLLARQLQSPSIAMIRMRKNLSDFLYRDLNEKRDAKKARHGSPFLMTKYLFKQFEESLRLEEEAKTKGQLRLAAGSGSGGVDDNNNNNNNNNNQTAIDFFDEKRITVAKHLLNDKEALLTLYPLVAAFEEHLRESIYKFFKDDESVRELREDILRTSVWHMANRGVKTVYMTAGELVLGARNEKNMIAVYQKLSTMTMYLSLMLISYDQTVDPVLRRNLLYMAGSTMSVQWLKKLLAAGKITFPFLDINSKSFFASNSDLVRAIAYVAVSAGVWELYYRGSGLSFTEGSAFEGNFKYYGNNNYLTLGSWVSGLTGNARVNYGYVAPFSSVQPRGPLQNTSLLQAINSFVSAMGGLLPLDIVLNTGSLGLQVFASMPFVSDVSNSAVMRDVSVAYRNSAHAFYNIARIGQGRTDGLESEQILLSEQIGIVFYGMALTAQYWALLKLKKTTAALSIAMQLKQFYSTAYQLMGIQSSAMMQYPKHPMPHALVVADAVKRGAEGVLVDTENYTFQAERVATLEILLQEHPVEAVNALRSHAEGDYKDSFRQLSKALLTLSNARLALPPPPSSSSSSGTGEKGGESTQLAKGGKEEVIGFDLKLVRREDGTVSFRTRSDADMGIADMSMSQVQVATDSILEAIAKRKNTSVAYVAKEARFAAKTSIVAEARVAAKEMKEAEDATIALEPKLAAHEEYSVPSRALGTLIGLFNKNVLNIIPEIVPVPLSHSEQKLLKEAKAKATSNIDVGLPDKIYTEEFSKKYLDGLVHNIFKGGAERVGSQVYDATRTLFEFCTDVNTIYAEIGDQTQEYYLNACKVFAQTNGKSERSLFQDSMVLFNFMAVDEVMRDTSEKGREFARNAVSELRDTVEYHLDTMLRGVAKNKHADLGAAEKRADEIIQSIAPSEWTSENQRRALLLWFYVKDTSPVYGISTATMHHNRISRLDAAKFNRDPAVAHAGLSMDAMTAWLNRSPVMQVGRESSRTDVRKLVCELTVFHQKMAQLTVAQQNSIIYQLAKDDKSALILHPAIGAVASAVKVYGEDNAIALFNKSYVDMAETIVANVTVSGNVQGLEIKIDDEVVGPSMWESLTSFSMQACLTKFYLTLKNNLQEQFKISLSDRELVIPEPEAAPQSIRDYVEWGYKPIGRIASGIKASAMQSIMFDISIDMQEYVKCSQTLIAIIKGDADLMHQLRARAASFTQPQSAHQTLTRTISEFGGDIGMYVISVMSMAAIFFWQCGVAMKKRTGNVKIKYERRPAGAPRANYDTSKDKYDYDREAEDDELEEQGKVTIPPITMKYGREDSEGDVFYDASAEEDTQRRRSVLDAAFYKVAVATLKPMLDDLYENKLCGVDPIVYFASLADSPERLELFTRAASSEYAKQERKHPLEHNLFCFHAFENEIIARMFHRSTCQLRYTQAEQLLLLGENKDPTVTIHNIIDNAIYKFVMRQVEKAATPNKQKK